GPERARHRAALALRGASGANSQGPHVVPAQPAPAPRSRAVSEPDPRVALLRARVRDVPDFPKPGILFRDLTPLMGDGVAMRMCIDMLAERIVRHRPEVIVAIESRGFIFGAPVATAL